MLSRLRYNKKMSGVRICIVFFSRQHKSCLSLGSYNNTKFAFSLSSDADPFFSEDFCSNDFDIKAKEFIFLERPGDSMGISPDKREKKYVKFPPFPLGDKPRVFGCCFKFS